MQVGTSRPPSELSATSASTSARQHGVSDDWLQPAPASTALLGAVLDRNDSDAGNAGGRVSVGSAARAPSAASAADSELSCRGSNPSVVAAGTVVPTAEVRSARVSAAASPLEAVAVPSTAEKAGEVMRDSSHAVDMGGDC